MDYEKIKEIKDDLARDCLLNIASYIGVNANEKDKANFNGICSILAGRIIELENSK